MLGLWSEESRQKVVNRNAEAECVKEAFIVLNELSHLEHSETSLANNIAESSAVHGENKKSREIHFWYSKEQEGRIHKLVISRLILSRRKYSKTGY